MNDRHLDDALRALPRREGRSDWNDLESRISALKPPRNRRMRRFASRRVLLSGIGFALVLGATALAWHRLPSAPDKLWKDAHRDAIRTDPWGDPWLAAAVETAR